jgi:hypothetical protein
MEDELNEKNFTMKNFTIKKCPKVLFPLKPHPLVYFLLLLDNSSK